MVKTENKHLCTKELIATDGIHFKKGNCYIGETKISDESLTLIGECSKRVSFYGGNDYLKRLVYRGKIAKDEDGQELPSKVEYIIFSNSEDRTIGTVWKVGNNEGINLYQDLYKDIDYMIEIRKASNNDIEMNKESIDRIEKLLNKKKVKIENTDNADATTSN